MFDSALLLTVHSYSMRPILTCRIPRDQRPVFGVTVLGDEVFVVRSGTSELEAYSGERFDLVRHVAVAELVQPWDLTSCSTFQCIYVADLSDPGRIHKVTLNVKTTSWNVDDDPYGLSVTSHPYCHVLVTCRDARKLKEFSESGRILREVLLGEDLLHPIHSVGFHYRHSMDINYVVCHGDGSDPLHRVCILDATGNVMRSYGGPPGSTAGQLNSPQRVAVDEEGLVLVADRGNKQILLMSSTMNDVRELAPGRGVDRSSGPWRMSMDAVRGRLLMTDHSNDDVLVLNVRNQVDVI